MKWCCPQLQGYVELAGQRGIAVIVDDSGKGKPHFFIQFRATDVERGLPDVPKTSIPICWATETGIIFCPWCGVRLEKWYGDKAKALVRADLKIPICDS